MQTTNRTLLANKYSRIAFENTNSKTKVTEQLSIAPLKIINPSGSAQSAFCMLSNYGGGFVQGDKVQLQVCCGENTQSVISSQANTRIFEGGGDHCYQHTSIDVKAGAIHFYLNDPLVMHKGSSFTQNTNISVATAGVMCLVEWFSAGRISQGECFDLDKYETNTSAYFSDKLVLKDRFIIDPKRVPPHSPGVFGNHTTYICIYLVGDQSDTRIQLLEKSLLKLCEVKSSETNISTNFSRVNKHVGLARVSAKEPLHLHPFMRTFAQHFEHPELLGFNPLKRKY